MDNATPIKAQEYDKKIGDTIPYYQEFYKQTFDIVEQCNFGKIDWLDLGCGTGSLEKLSDDSIKYVCADSTGICYENCFDVVTAIQSHHYMKKEERRKATECVYRALKGEGIYICFENVVPEDAGIKEFEVLRWARYQQSRGKTKEDARAHSAIKRVRLQ